MVSALVFILLVVWCLGISSIFIQHKPNWPSYHMHWNWPPFSQVFYFPSTCRHGPRPIYVARPTQPNSLVPLPLRITLFALVFVPKRNTISRPSHLPTFGSDLLPPGLAITALRHALMLTCISNTWSFRFGSPPSLARSRFSLVISSLEETRQGKKQRKRWPDRLA